MSVQTGTPVDCARLPAGLVPPGHVAKFKVG
jgi:hypothetical protein